MSQKTLIPVILLILGICGVLYAIFTLYRKFSAEKHLIEALKEDSIEKFKRHYNIQSGGGVDELTDEQLAKIQIAIKKLAKEKLDEKDGKIILSGFDNNTNEQRRRYINRILKLTYLF